MMQLVRILPKGQPIRGRKSVELSQKSNQFCRGVWRGPWGQRCLLQTLTLVCVTLVVLGLFFLAISEGANAQKRALQYAARLRRAGHRDAAHHQALPANVVFKVEPLLRRDAPSVELAAQGALNAARALQLARLIKMGDNYTRVHLSNVPSHSKVPAPRCPSIPPTLQMPLAAQVGFNVSAEFDLQVARGGSWHPPHCSARHRVALVVPFRDRWQHLTTLLAHLHPLLQRHQVTYTIFVVEQFGNDTFNKGAIMNAAFLSVIQRGLHTGFDCFIFHDVDLIPEDARNLYTCPSQPRHMSVAVDELNYRLPYKILVGGVFAIRSEHFFRVNGYSNLYWGWGGEDDDMGYRVQQADLLISRPPEWIARYKMLKHVKRRPLAWKVRNKLLRTSGRRYRLDGLNTVRFRLLHVEKHSLFTKLLVDVGTQPNNIRMLQYEAEHGTTGSE